MERAALPERSLELREPTSLIMGRKQACPTFIVLDSK